MTVTGIWRLGSEVQAVWPSWGVRCVSWIMYQGEKREPQISRLWFLYYRKPKLNNLRHGLAERRPRYFTAMVRSGMWLSAWRFLGQKPRASASPCLWSCRSACPSGVLRQGPRGLPGTSKASAPTTQPALPFSSDLFLFGLCSFQQIGYALAKQFGSSAPSVTFSCLHMRSYHRRGRLKSFQRWLWWDHTEIIYKLHRKISLYQRIN